MQFKDVIGQQEVARHLTEMLNQNRLSHAMLFFGREGAGALPLAFAFAQFMVCEKVNGKADFKGPSLFEAPPADAPEIIYTDSCGECNACRKAQDLVHPDIHFSYPVITKKAGDKPTSKDFIKEWRQFFTEQPYGNMFDWLQFIGAENKQGNIPSAECEDILHKMTLKSFEADYKILIMWMPEMLGKEGNKLLKLIEEPPPNTLFILVAENEERILPTLISRTQSIKIPMLQRQQVAAALQQRENITAEKADQVAAISGGNYHEALQLIQHADDDWEVLLRDWLNTILRTGPAAQVKWIDEAAKMGREKQKQFLKYFTHLLQHAIKVRTLGLERAGKTESQSTNDFASRINKMSTLSQQDAIISELDNAAYYIERNANAKMLFHDLTIKLYHIISNKSVILVH